MKTAIALALIAVSALAVWPASAQQQKKGSDQTRSVQGMVTGPDDKAVAGAVVQLKNTKTLQIRSFLTKEDGSYYFHGLSPDIDYELSAKAGEDSSGTKTLSSFDSRKEAVINLKLNPKK
jgi:Carboxypeptidase regulatory-like domain